MKKLFGVLMVLAACGSSGWSEKAQNGFIEGCLDANLPIAFCNCMLDKAQAEWTEDEMMSYVEKGEFPTATFTKMAEACEK